MHTIKQQWDTYRACCVPADASPAQVRETKRAVYAGIEIMMRLMRKAGDTKLTEAESMKMLADIEDEMTEFKNQVVAGTA
ncbi:hypothetical protein [Nevskia sp.]|uniref:hypothetical protein n=1 Tax=Nevskia sp. TaxID=1929292 RepID=UPI0025E689E0|nr:hypothetical protein [Nevskia sp.]